MDLNNVLKEFGLSDKESEIYLTLLKGGPSTVAELAKKTSVLRQSIYDVLDKMISKGIIGHSISNNVKVFHAVDTKILVQLLEDKKKLLIKSLPEFEKLKLDHKSLFNVKTFVGYKGLKNIWADMLVVGQDTYFIIDYDIFGTLFKELFIQNFIAKRIEKGFSHNVIFTSKSNTPQIYEKSEPERLRNVRYLTKIKDFKSTVFFYGDKMGFFSMGEQPTAILIDDKDAVTSMKAIYNILWEISDPA